VEFGYSLTDTDLTSRTEAKAQFFDPTLHSIFEFTDEIYYFGRYSILIIFLFIIYPSLATVGSFPHPSLLSHSVWDGKVLMHPYLYAHCSITILLRL